MSPFLFFGALPATLAGVASTLASAGTPTGSTPEHHPVRNTSAPRHKKGRRGAHAPDERPA